MADYYARRNGVLIGPFGLYDEATGWHAKQERHHQARADDMAVLLNLGTLANGNPNDLRDVLKYDPVLRSIFELGRRVGEAGWHEADAELVHDWHTKVGPVARNWPKS